MIQRLSTQTAKLGAVPTHFATPCNSVPGRLTARWIDDRHDLRRRVGAWQELVETSLHPNLAFEPCFLLPALEHLNDSKAKVLVVERGGSSARGEDSQWCLLMPLVARRLYRLPFQSWQVWKHEQCFDATPLLRADCAVGALRVALQFLRAQGGQLLGFDMISDEKPFRDAFRKALEAESREVFVRKRFERACFRPEKDADAYFKTHVSKGLRKNARRMQRRLQSLGELAVSVTDSPEECTERAHQFLSLEAAGWKGKAGTALNCQPQTRRFFQDMVQLSAQSRRVRFLTLSLDGHPIAMLCDLHTARRGYSYKTAFDEQFAAYSPGVLAELFNVEAMHDAGAETVDSCTEPDNPTLNRIWGQRTAFQSVIVSLQGNTATWLVRRMPALQQVLSRLRRLRKTES